MLKEYLTIKNNMAEINYKKVSKQFLEELYRVKGELGVDWELNTDNFQGFQKMPEKSYTARAEVNMVYNRKERGRNPKKVTGILFQSGNTTGDGFVPRKKDGEAELYISIGSNVNGLWMPRLTCLDAITINEGGERLRCYKHLTSSPLEYSEGIDFGTNVVCPKRFDFTFDRADGYGDPHFIAFNLTTRLSLPFDIDYQIGAFVSFQEPCEELDILKGIVNEDTMRRFVSRRLNQN